MLTIQLTSKPQAVNLKRTNQESMIVRKEANWFLRWTFGQATSRRVCD